MLVSYEEAGEVQIAAIEGRINGSNADELEETLLALLNKGSQKLVLDFSGVDYISSAGLRVVLLIAKQTAAASGTLVLCGMQAGVFEVFEMCGFVDILNIDDTRATALARF
ncbi:MAG: STAS domain-containing protein [Zoogloeaceae bacterium]|jgi:stage II sporulation protein AA (anti-sigma F factor antagonist)|nr:STAS domain-containing protein [Zoogloeaceae bacterium]